MALVINSNPAATAASNNLNTSNTMLQKSLGRLSSGFKIQGPADDAGGLAVSMKMQAALRRTDALVTNIGNAVSFLQTQDGALDSANQIVARMSELAALSTDKTKNTTDLANYDTEFTDLKAQLTSLTSEKFNSVDLFGAAATTLAVVTSEEDETTTLDITVADLTTAVTGVTALTAVSGSSISVYTTALQNIATLRAKNGAETNRLQFASNMLSTKRTNIESANSRIIDTDVAAESTRFARNNILVQSGTAMLAQANSSAQSVLRLLS
jgi:flagellin